MPEFRRKTLSRTWSWLKMRFFFFLNPLFILPFSCCSLIYFFVIAVACRTFDYFERLIWRLRFDPMTGGSRKKVKYVKRSWSFGSFYDVYNLRQFFSKYFSMTKRWAFRCFNKASRIFTSGIWIGLTCKAWKWSRLFRYFLCNHLSFPYFPKLVSCNFMLFNVILKPPHFLCQT